MIIDNRKIKTRQQATWVISVAKDIANINLSCINNAWLALVAKIVWINLKQATLYKWIYYIPDGNPVNPMHGTRLLISVMRMHCAMSTHITQDTQDAIHLNNLQMDCGNSTNVVLQKTIDDITE